MFQKNILLTFLVGIVLLACSKDKRIEKVVYKKDGNWKVSTIEWNQILQTQNGQSITSGTSTNVGEFTFDESGSGSYNFTIADSNVYAETFNWAVSDENISIAKVSQSFDFSGNIKQIAVAFSGTQKSKTELTIEGSETLQGFTGDFTQRVLTAKITLTK